MPWNADLQALARKTDKLVFVETSADGGIPQNIKYELKKHYIFTVLDKNKNPADFFIFDTFLREKTRTNNPFACAILTPTLKPIFVSAKTDTTRLEKILVAVAHKHAKNRHLLRTSATTFATYHRAITSEHFASAALLSAITSGLHTSNIKKQNTQQPIAQLTENARLHFRTLKHFRTFFSLNATRASLNQLKKRYALETDSRAKKLIARALADIAFAVDKNTISELKIQADTIVTEKSVAEPLVDSALNLAVLSRAYSIFGEKTYLQKAKKLAHKISLYAFGNAAIPAILPHDIEHITISSNDSIACALGMSLAANALCDFHKISNDPTATHAALAIIKKLDTHYQFGGVWTLNSQNSPSANFARPSIFDDEILPSHIGEAYQAIVHIKRELGLRTISPVEISLKNFENFLISPFVKNRDSIRIAALSNKW